MSQVLVVSSNEKGMLGISSLLREYELSFDIHKSSSGSEARRIILENDLALVVVNAPLSDESGEDLSVMVTEQSMAASILLVKGEYFETTQLLFGEQGVLVVSKPIIRQVFFQSLALARSMRRRLSSLKNENDKLQKKIEEIKLIDRAKLTLMQTFAMNEQQAHRHIEQEAMNLRISRYEVACAIIQTYR